MSIRWVRTVIIFAICVAPFLLPVHASAQTVLVDTGQPTAAFGISLCAKSCGAGATFQNLAGQFSLAQASSIASVQAWIQAPGTGGQLAVAIRTDNSGFPGQVIYSQTYTVPNQTTSGWVMFTFTNQPILNASTPYWVSFEPVVGSTLFYNMTESAPNPLAIYTLYNSLNSGPIVESLGLGIRITGTNVAAPTLLVDTGAGGTNVADAFGLFASGNTNCSPQPSCGQSFQFLAGQISLTQAASIQSVQGWMGGGASGGPIDITIYTENHGTPGTSVFTQRYTIGALPSIGWVTFPISLPYPDLPAGTYWLAFEPVANTNSQFEGMFNGAPNPLNSYAANNNFLGYHAFPASLGMRVLGSSFPGLSYGTAARTIMTGYSFGLPDIPQDFILGGDKQVNTSPWNFIIPSGWSFARGTVYQNSLLAGAYSSTSGPCGGVPHTCGAGAGRGVAYRSWSNPTSSPITFHVNAVLDGEFQNSGMTASAGVYLFDSTVFTNTIAGSGQPAPQFLLGGSTLTALAAGGGSLASLFPSNLTNVFQIFNAANYPTSTLLTIPLTSGFITLQSGQSFTMMFDVSAYAPGFGTANFASTLGPSPTLPLFTDVNGNAVTQLVAVGPSAPLSVPATSLVLTPSSASNPVGTTGSVTATVMDASSKPVPNAIVFFAFNSGPNLGPAGPVSTDSNGQAVFAYAGNGGPGTDVIQASLGALTASPVSITWTVPGPLDHIVISPAAATIPSGGSQPYTAAAFDRFNNSIGDVTPTTVFTITPDGSCTAATCTATTSGPHTVTGTYSGDTAQASLTVAASQTTPVITWATPAAITYGTSLSATQLNATANVPGAFIYSPASGTVLTAGSQTLAATFTPTDTTAYTTASAQVTLVVNKATPVITWATPASVAFGTALSATQLNATANVPGAFVYAPAAGAIPAAGTDTLSVTFTPTDSVDYSTATATVSLVVNTSTPVITWPTPAAITYGTALSAIQLNATASVAGTFVYSPAAGVVPNAGSQPLSVTFTPTDTTDYTSASAHVTLVVNKATPVLTWATPAAITFGTPLGATQLNAAASVAGTFVYNPASGAVLPAGTQLLSANFTPTNTTNYNSASATVNLLVNKATPVITWPTPAAITFGTALSGVQLNATANVPGTFAYNPMAGTIPSGGTDTLSVTFTPSDTVDYMAATASVSLVVTTTGKTNPVITWPTPAPITYGTPVTAAQLDATANVAGTFTYTPKAGTILTAGPQTLSATFSPANTAAYNTVSASVTLLVNQARPFVIWFPLPTIYGTPLGQFQLDALTIVPGNFTYTPSAGTVLGAGKQQLSAIFTPNDSTDFETITVQATLVVLKAVPDITWATPASITLGTPLGAAQLDASANVPGTFVYSPAAGRKLAEGSWDLTATFTPADSANYQTAHAEVDLRVKSSQKDPN